MEKDDDALFRCREESVEVRVCAVDEGRTRWEDVPAAELIMLNEARGGCETIGL